MENRSNRRLERYIEAHTTAPSDQLIRLERETHLKTMAPQMISGHVQGRLLSFLSHWIRPRYALEIGTFTGYAAICLAEGLADGGQLHTIEGNSELAPLIKQGMSEAGYEDRVIVHFGDALEILPTLDMRFDLVFIDAAKQLYSQFYDLVIDKVNPGGCLLADNVLWSNQVLDESGDADTKSLQAFNKKVMEDNRVENLLLPLRDGIMVCRKK